MRKPTLLLFLVFGFASIACIGALLSYHSKEAGQEGAATPISTKDGLAKKKAALGTISINLSPTADSTVDSSNPTTNYGTGTSLAAGWYDATPPNPDQALRFLIKFDLTAIPSNATINSATLGLYLWWGSGTPGLNWLIAGQNSGSWTEYGVNWNNRPGYFTNVRSTIDTLQGWKTFNVKPIVSEWVAGTKANYGFQVLDGESGNTWYRYFNSREYSSNKPYLLVNYTLPDTTPPTISNAAVSEITKNSAKITWSTDENSTSYVDYGLTNAYGTTAGQDDNITSHAVTLSGLSAGQLFHFRVRSKDAANNEAASGDYTFTTTADTSSGTNANVSTNTGVNTSHTTVEPIPATGSAAFIAAKKSTPSATTSANKTNQGTSKFAGIKTPILTAIALLIILAIGGLVYFFKFRRGHSAKNTQIEIQTPAEPNKPGEEAKAPKQETPKLPDQNNRL